MIGRRLRRSRAWARALAVMPWLSCRGPAGMSRTAGTMASTTAPIAP